METATPILQKQRTAIVDILRGWALLGVVLMNYVDYYYLGIDWKTFKPDTTTGILMGFGNILFAAKSWTMLSFLFGYGFAVLMDNIASKGMNPVQFFSRRMFWLFMLAIVNSALFFGDILKDYAMMGMLLLLFHRASARVAFVSAIILLLAIPAIGAYINSLGGPGGFDTVTPLLPYLQSSNPLKVFYFQLYGTVRFEFLNLTYVVTIHCVMFSCLLLGLAAKRIHFFENIHANKKYVKRVFWSTLAGAILIGVYFAVTQAMKLNINKYYNIGFWFILSSMFFIASALSWLYVAGKLKAFFRSMQVIGKMTLTNYMTQNALALILFSGIGFGLVMQNRIHFGYYMLFALTIYIAQVYFSKWWLSRYQFGPIEWVWRQLSYNKKLPLKKQKTTVEEEPVVPAVSIFAAPAAIPTEPGAQL